MRADSKVPIKNSIATRMLLILLGLFLLTASLAAVIRLSMNYAHHEKSILQDLESIESAFIEPLAVSLWNIDEEALQVTVEGILKMPTIVGVKIVNANRETIAVGGIVSEQGEAGNVGLHVNMSGCSEEGKTSLKEGPLPFALLERHFSVKYTHKGKITVQGEVTLFSSTEVIYGLMKMEFMTVLFAVAIGLTTFFFALLWTFHRYLRKPLSILTNATASISLDNIGEFSVDTGVTQHNEIKQLEETMTSMVQHLHDALRKQKESEARYRHLYEENPSMYFTVGADGVIRSVNEYGAQKLGYKVDELVGKSFFEILHQEDRKEARKHLADSMMHPGEMGCWEVRKLRSDGSVMWARDNVRVMVASNDDLVALVVCEDITERVEFDKREKDIQEQLARAQRMESLAVLSGGVAHDLNNVLGPVVALPGLIREDVENLIANSSVQMRFISHYHHRLSSKSAGESDP